MYQKKNVVVVMPAYDAEATLLQTHGEVLAQDYLISSSWSMMPVKTGR